MFNLLIMNLSDVISANRVRIVNVELAVFNRIFFFMIQVSNQLLPKTKVVDLLFPYNFYFGRISSSYMKS